MRSNERRFIDNALNNTAWAVVVDVGENPRIDSVEYSSGETLHKFAYPLVLASNENWKYFCSGFSYINTHYKYGMVFFHYDTAIRRWHLDVLQQLSIESPNSCWASVLEDQNPRISVGDMFIICTNGGRLSMRFLNRIEKCFLNLYKDTIINVLEQYNVPIPKNLDMKLQEATIL